VDAVSAPRAKLGRLRIRLAAGTAGADEARALGRRLERELSALSPGDWADLARTPRRRVRTEPDADDGAVARAVSRALRRPNGEGGR
jgi:hypothetical protein